MQLKWSENERTSHHINYYTISKYNIIICHIAQQKAISARCFYVFEKLTLIVITVYGYLAPPYSLFSYSQKMYFDALGEFVRRNCCQIKLQKIFHFVSLHHRFSI